MFRRQLPTILLLVFPLLLTGCPLLGIPFPECARIKLPALTEWAFTEHTMSDIRETSDGDLIAVGKPPYEEPPAGRIVLTDSSGDIRWTKSYAECDLLAKVCETSDGGFCAVGKEGYQLYAIKTDADGEKQWSKVYTEEDGYDIVGMREAPGGYLIARQNLSYDLRLCQIGEDGTLLWSKTMDPEFPSLRGCIETSDGGLLAFSGGDNIQVCLLKLSDNGTEQWRYYGAGPSPLWEEVCGVAESAHGGYFLLTQTWCWTIGAYPQTFGTYMHKLNENGSVEWVKPYNTAFSLRCLRPTLDGGCIALSGRSRVYKLNGGGWPEWSKEYYDPEDQYLRLNSILPLSNGGYIVTGTGLISSNTDYGFLLRLYASGNIS